MIRHNKIYLIALISVGVIFSIFTRHTLGQTSFTVTKSGNSIPLYEIEELTFSLPTTYSNPYNPDSIKVDAKITTPQGTVNTAAGFWFENVKYQSTGNDRYTLIPNTGVWKVRYAPRQIGQYRFHIEAVDANGTTSSSEDTFTAVSSSNKGFIKKDPQNPYRFMYDNGEPYILLGTNQAWHYDPLSYDSLFAKFKQQKLNMVRVWLTFYDPSPHFQLEMGRKPNFVTKSMEKVPAWPAPTSAEPYKIDVVKFEGINRYNQENAYKLDHLLQSAKDNDMYLMLTTWDFHTFGGDNFDWWDIDNPYRDIIGGASRSDANAFWSNTTAKKYFKYYIRYIGARYGAYSSLGVLEFWNELDKAPSDPTGSSATRQAMSTWHQEMKDAFYTADPNHQITSTSFARLARPDTEAQNTTCQNNQDTFCILQMLDLAQGHYYNGRDDYASFLSSAVRWAQNKYNKPYIMGEYGRQGEELQVPQDVTGKLPQADLIKLTRLNHHSIWNPIMHAGGVGSALFWRISGTGVIPWYGCCNEFVTPPQGILDNYTVFANWIQSETPYLRSMQFFWAGKIQNIEIGGYKKSNRAILYFFNTNGPWTKEDNQISAVTSTYTVTGLTNGTYTISYTNPFTGQQVGTITTGQVINGTLSLTTPSFKRDIAVKVYDPNETPAITIVPSPTMTNTPVPPTNTQAASTPTPAYLRSDFGGLGGAKDGKVDIQDFNILAGEFYLTGTTLKSNIINTGLSTDKVDIQDYNAFVGDYQAYLAR